MKVSFGYEQSSFSRDKCGNCGPKLFGGTIKTHEILQKQHFFPFLGYVSYIFSISAFLSKCTAGKKIRGNFYENQTQKSNFWRELLRKSHKNQTQKTKFLEENAAKIVLFEKKNIF